MGKRLQQIRLYLHTSPYLSDEYFTTSYILPQPLVSLIRTLIFLYCLTVVVANLVINIIHDAGWNWASYFTTLSYIGIVLYYGFAAYNSIRRTLLKRISNTARAPSEQSPDHTLESREDGTFVDQAGPNVSHKGKSPEPSLADELNQHSLNNTAIGSTLGDKCGLVRRTPPSSCLEPPAVDRVSDGLRTSTLHQTSLFVQWILYESFTCYAPLVSLVYWVFLYPTQGGFSEPIDAWGSVSMHGANSVLMLVEVFLVARIKCKWWHLAVLIVVLALYLGLAYFMVAVYDFYVYPFFEPKFFGGYIAVICAFIVDFVAVVWVVLMIIHRVRDRVYLKVFTPKL